MDISSYIRRNLLKIAYPITLTIGKIHSPFAHKYINGLHYFNLASKLKPGMVFLTRIRGEASNIFIPGEYTHGAIYVGNNLVVEAVGKGVIIKDLITFMLTKDFMKVKKPEFITGTVEEQDTVMKIAAEWALSQVGLPYDYQFKGGNKAWYCFELVYAAFREALNGDSPFELRETWGEPTVTGEDIEATSKFSDFWDSKECLSLQDDLTKLSTSQRLFLAGCSSDDRAGLGCLLLNH